MKKTNFLILKFDSSLRYFLFAIFFLCFQYTGSLMAQTNIPYPTLKSKADAFTSVENAYKQLTIDFKNSFPSPMPGNPTYDSFTKKMKAYSLLLNFLQDNGMTIKQALNSVYSAATIDETTNLIVLHFSTRYSGNWPSEFREIVNTVKL